MLNLRSVISVIGILICICGIGMLTCIPVALLYQESDILPFIISSSITLLFGFGLWLIFKQKPLELSNKDGFLIVTSGWIAISLFGSLPYLLTGSINSFHDAFFETISGFTTTGASIITDVEKLSHSILFWRSLTHWIGGMGIIVLSLAILPILGVAGMQLYRAETSGVTKDKLKPRIAETARLFGIIYFILTALEVLLLFLGGMPIFDAICHSFGTIATGGFSTKNASISYYQSPFIDYVVGIFMFLSATNFSLHYSAFKGDITNYFRNSEFKFFLSYVSIAIITVTIINFFSQPNTALTDIFRYSFFNVISSASCTGFANADFALWASSAQFILIILMFIGGCAGSTTGAIKSVRILLMLKNSFKEANRILHPQAIINVKFNNRTVEQELLTTISSFFIFYVSIFFLSSLTLIATGVDIISAISGVISCMGGVGPGLNTVGPMANYSHLPIMAKYTLSIDMLFGRLELFPVMVIFTKSFWVL